MLPHDPVFQGNGNGNGHMNGGAIPTPDVMESYTKARPLERSIQGRFHPPVFETTPFGGANVFEALLPYMQAAADTAPTWSYWPQNRDRYLRNFWKTEPVIAGTVYTLSSKVHTLSYHLEGNKRNTKKYWHELFGMCDGGAGLSELFRKTVECLLTQDNGAFWELRGAGNPDGPLRGRVQNIYFIDPAQCWRSIDPEYPVYYVNPYTGQIHRLHHTRVVRLSSMTQPDELGRAVGFCAVSRAFAASQFMRAVNKYKYEKVTGNFKRALALLQGVGPKKLDRAINAADEESEAASLSTILGIPTITRLNGELTGQILDLASIPDGFDTEKDMTIYVYIMALAFGVDVREIWPATASGATKADATIQHLKGLEKGIGELIQTLERAINWSVIGMDSDVEIKMDYVDVEQQRLKAEIDRVKTETYRLALDGGAITSEQFQALLIADEITDPNVLASANPQARYDDQAPNTTDNLPESDVETFIEQEEDQADDEGPNVNPDSEDESENENAAETGANNANRRRKEKEGYQGKEAAEKAAKNAEFEPISTTDIERASRELDRILGKSA